MIKNNIGTIYTRIQQFEKSIDCYKELLSIKPEFELAWKNLTVNYYNAGNYTGSIETPDKVKTEGDLFLTVMGNEERRGFALKKPD